MTPMLEKAARAVDDYIDQRVAGETGGHDFRTGVARAVLLAVRDMPPETQVAIFDARDGFVHELDIPAVWQAGIDAILKGSE